MSEQLALFQDPQTTFGDWGLSPSRFFCIASSNFARVSFEDGGIIARHPISVDQPRALDLAHPTSIGSKQSLDDSSFLSHEAAA
jgi:hypothetical protein